MRHTIECTPGKCEPLLLVRRVAVVDHRLRILQLQRLGRLQEEHGHHGRLPQPPVPARQRAVPGGAHHGHGALPKLPKRGGRHLLCAVGAVGLEHVRLLGLEEEGGGPRVLLLPRRLFDVEDLCAVLANTQAHHGAVLGG